jgi:hypothetical protein
MAPFRLTDFTDVPRNPDCFFFAWLRDAVGYTHLLKLFVPLIGSRILW